MSIFDIMSSAKPVQLEIAQLQMIFDLENVNEMHTIHPLGNILVP
jgi:hypothetical protein